MTHGDKLSSWTSLKWKRGGWVISNPVPNIFSLTRGDGESKKLYRPKHDRQWIPLLWQNLADDVLEYHVLSIKLTITRLSLDYLEPHQLSLTIDKLFYFHRLSPDYQIMDYQQTIMNNHQQQNILKKTITAWLVVDVQQGRWPSGSLVLSEKRVGGWGNHH